MKKTLNIGAGERIYDYYPTNNYKCVNFDERDIEGIDVKGDVKNLNMFSDGEFDLILASDIIEHFPISQIQGMLKEWSRVLAADGMIEFRLPNLAAICKQYISNKDARNVSWLLYGGQDYSGNFHYTGYDRQLFSEECMKAGLVEVTYSEEGFNMVVRVKKAKK